ncbi:MAG: trypsin-like peptidase domain-containing protein [Sulfolobales archaeon]|nr:trypsin-like peptidase domain-containing protein [Sulfolobales archaeon]MCX8186734.1 trypsin-like peptidase domain-containing protein [Sulfolobales archaeon]MDW7969693.1 trypsin-like peptidase domain-containing protein [Sulfolobales archaeon]
MRLDDLSNEISKVISKSVRSVVALFTVSYAYDFMLNPVPVRGAGSGFAVGKNLIVTNNHVISGSSKISVITSDGTRMNGEVISTAPWKDLALISVEGDLERMPLGDSTNVKIGELVFAVGNPLGLWSGPTVTMGVISAVGRSIAAKPELILEDLIQTDAAINPGNSGGPLININGEAIGVTTAIIPFAQGIGFAIPIEDVKLFLDQVNRYGKAIRAWIGVYVVDVTPELVKTYRLPVDKGVIIINVLRGSPAEGVGLRQSDIIVEVDGNEIRSSKDLRKAAEKAIEKGYIKVKIVRGYKEFYVEIPLIIE